ncbi:MAG: DegT/DnrJ/EryC1/StrS family aminotransferase, partial [candidate division Zixibacteria bacterium]|nr:DegT/DnrJ/EryC1/StrS family aminotransferase [candidate division Zixibacteria bacterium]
MKVPFFRLKLGSAEKRAVSDVLKSGWITTGPRVREFEQKICKLTNAKHAIAVSSGTAGLFLGLKALSIGKGDEVITTAFTMVATVEAILHVGAKPVLTDIDPVTLNIDIESVKRKITKKTKAIICVDMAGWPCDYKSLKKLTRENNLYLIDDAAHALGSKYLDKPIGSVADLSVFSFYPTKNITSGEGGMVVSNSKRVINKIKHLSLHAMSSSGWKRYSGGSWKYDIIDLGYKFNLSDLSAGLALGQLKRFGTLYTKRKNLAERYKKKLSDLSKYVELPFEDNISTHAWHL